VQAAIDAVSVGSPYKISYVHIPYGVSVTLASLTLSDYSVLVLHSAGYFTYIFKDNGATPAANSGLAIRSGTANGVILRSHDEGVAADPFLQIIDLTNGDLAAIRPKYAELAEISAPTTPAADKVRLYADVTGTDTRVMAKFQDGSAVEVARQSDYTLTGSVVWDPASIAKNDIAETSITVTGAVLGDFVLVSSSIDLSGLTLSAHVGAADTVHVVLHNGTVGAVDLGSGTYYAKVFKRF
jgi:hypothetical protein